MEVTIKPETVNGAPLPQRTPKNDNLQQKKDFGDPTSSGVGGGGGAAEKKPRFAGDNFQQPNQNQGGGGVEGNMQQNQGGNFQNRGGNNQQNRRRGGRGGGFSGGGGGGQNHNVKNEQNDNSSGVGSSVAGGGGGHDRRGGGGGGHDRRGGGGGGGDRRGGGGGGGRNDDFFIARRLEAISGPTHEIPPIECEETKFSGRNRLYVGNLTDVNENELREMFKPFGEIAEIFANSEKNFAFLKVDFHANAEKAKRELDGMQRKGRALRVRFAPNATILRVKNLTPFVSNELLYKSFEIFGPVEKAVIVVDDRGKHTGEGIVEFVKKSSSMAAMRLCNDKCFFLTASLRPCVVEPFELNDDTDGLPDKGMNKKTQEFHYERNAGPRFADSGSFEHEYGSKWKQLHELHKNKQESLKRELRAEEEKLEAEMDFARYEHETEILRRELAKREQDNKRKKMEWEMREKHAEEQKKRDEEQMRQQHEEMQERMNRQNEDIRRRQQENTLFMQAQQLNSLLDQHEINQGGSNLNNAGNNFGGGGNGGGSGVGGNNNQQQDQQQQQQQQQPFNFGGNNQQQFGGNQNQQNPNQQRGGGGGGGGNNNPGNFGGNNKPWERRDDFQNKRRRF